MMRETTPRIMKRLTPSGGFDTARSARYYGALRGGTEELRLAPRAVFPCPSGIPFGQDGPGGKLVFHANWPR
ncbi:protein of unknown function [Denitratisoma oestradiolicum]|uniref:Uncharacterized protein n=1 Tax=Denitratisoma oestradiolicum TaxID=311182 RepID=A0A6S6XZB4_9PROT|nr:protein of unknown function [Denitratisoma oestradiolicum]